MRSLGAIRDHRAQRFACAHFTESPLAVRWSISGRSECERAAEFRRDGRIGPRGTGPVTNEVALVTCQRGRPTLRNWCWVKARPRAIKDGDCGNFSTMRGKFAVFDLAGTFLALLWVVLPLNFAGLTCNNVGYSCS